MIKSRLLAGVALAVLCLPVAALSPGMPLGAAPAQAQSASVSFNLFFEQLEPHGVWVRNARYNYVFCPTGVDANWRPYSNGRWLYLEDRGWYFASDEPHAWATYHYGRWFADQELGWCWVPGTKWAPAWVSWRRSDNIVGWAPLPPEGDGYAVATQISRRELPEGYWVYVPTERFVEPDLSISIVFGSDQPDYYQQTEFLGPVVVEGDVVINNIIDVTYIEQNINQQVIVYQPEEATDPAAETVNVEAQAIVIFDQDVAEPVAEEAPPEAVEEADAAATIETEGGTAGSTAELPAETETAPADAAPAEGAPAETPATEAPTTEQPAADAPAEGEAAPAEAEQPAEGAPADAAPAPDATTPAEPAEDEIVCAPEVRVDGECPPLDSEEPATEAPAEPEAEAPAAEAPAEEAPAPEAPAEEAAPAPEAPAEEAAPAPEAPAEEAAPAPEAPAEEAAPAPEAPAEEAAPAPEAPAAEEPAPAPEAAPAEGEAPAAQEPPCPPETLVDGKCPVVPAQ